MFEEMLALGKTIYLDERAIKAIRKAIKRKTTPKGGEKTNGASDRARTGDPRFTRAVLYQLSYAGGHVMTQLRRQRLSMIRDIANPRKCSGGFSHFKCTNIGDVMSCSYGSQAEWGSDGSTQDSSYAYR